MSNGILGALQVAPTAWLLLIDLLCTSGCAASATILLTPFPFLGQRRTHQGSLTFLEHVHSAIANLVMSSASQK